MKQTEQNLSSLMCI